MLMLPAKHYTLITLFIGHGFHAMRVNIYVYIYTFNFSSVRRSPTMRPQQDFSRSFCSCCCTPLLSCSFLAPLGLLSHYLSTSLVVFLCILYIQNVNNHPTARKTLLKDLVKRSAQLTPCYRHYTDILGHRHVFAAYLVLQHGRMRIHLYSDGDPRQRSLSLPREPSTPQE